MFNQQQIQEFEKQGFLVERRLADNATCEAMIAHIKKSLNPPLAPLEFETDVHYPGSPADRLSEGGDTPRRLLHAYTRDALFRDWSTSPHVVERVKQLMGAERIQVSQNHHNCIMTKHPGFSSATLWHQDIRYWLFDQPELISVWLALGKEFDQNGGMHLIPGTHQHDLDRGYYDAAYFLRTDLEENQALINSAISADMEAGDVLFFHCKTLHAAGRNQTDQVKYSLVFTYHDENNQPIAGSRSAAFPDIPC
ncbi:MAG: phytanoyl-CoA dioxygenase family protein [Acidiferrobacterales bacterium]|nr:phytanoyl-CoA dioxygenase family protein [Acidiferrobacterales bacterium]